MIKHLSDRIAYFFIENEIINNDNYEVCSYGLEILISAFINTTLAIIIGIFLRRLVGTIIFLITFCIIRQFSGGYHAKSNRLCICTFISIFTSAIVIAPNIYSYT